MESFKKLFEVWRWECSNETLQTPHEAVFEEFLSTFRLVKEGTTPPAPRGSLQEEVVTTTIGDFQFLLRDYVRIRFQKIVESYLENGEVPPDAMLYSFELPLKRGLVEYSRGVEAILEGKPPREEKGRAREGLEATTTEGGYGGESHAVLPTQGTTATPPQEMAEVFARETAAEPTLERGSATSRQVPASVVRSEPELLLVRFLDDCLQFVGTDKRTYGPFHRENLAYLPARNAAQLIKKKVAQNIVLE